MYGGERELLYWWSQDFIVGGRGGGGGGQHKLKGGKGHAFPPSKGIWGLGSAVSSSIAVWGSAPAALLLLQFLTHSISAY